MKIKLDNVQTWLITGCAGFIGSNLLEFLLNNNQIVIGLDNFATGFRRNLEEVEKIVGNDKWQNFTFIEGDIRDFSSCINITKNIDIVLHQAGLGSVPRSINDPLMSHNVNVTGFLNMLKASVENKVKRFVYASSSSVYGDHPDLPKQEHKIGNQLSPYAVTKYSNELYAQVFAKNYGIEVIGLRYFNVFGKRQDPNGSYAAVIPLWFKAILNNNTLVINGDGNTSRDFCYIDNIVAMNILSGLTKNTDAINKVYNVACGQQTTLIQLFEYIKNIIDSTSGISPVYNDSRPGDIKHSLADISRARDFLGYEVLYDVKEGLSRASLWYQEFFQA